MGFLVWYLDAFNFQHYVYAAIFLIFISDEIPVKSHSSLHTFDMFHPSASAILGKADASLLAEDSYQKK